MTKMLDSPQSSGRYIVWVIATLTAIAGVAVLSPWYLPPEPLGLLAGLVKETNVHVASAITIGVCIPALIGAVTKQYKWTKRGALWLFSFYIFNAVTRILIVGSVGNLLWFPSVIIAAVLATIYLFDRRMHRWTPSL